MSSATRPRPRRAPSSGPLALPVRVIAFVLRCVVVVVSVAGTTRRVVFERDRRARGADPLDALAGDVARAQRRRLSEAQKRERIRRAQRLRRRLRLVAWFGGLVVVLTLSYQIPRASLFAVDHVAVVGASAVPDLLVRNKIDRLVRNDTIYTVDRDRIERELLRLPFVNAVQVDRHFPDTISVTLHEYAPLAFGVTGNAGWLVARDGRILTRARIDDWRGRVPIVRIEGGSVRLGDRVGNEPALRVLRAVPSDFPGSFRTVDVKTSGTIVGQLLDGPEVRFGRDAELAQKLLVVARLLGLFPGDRSNIAYIDVSVVARPAVCMVEAQCAIADPVPAPSTPASTARDAAVEGDAVPTTSTSDAAAGDSVRRASDPGV